jgi:hypothetical protein
MATFQFVDQIAASPTVRLDLNSYAGGLMVADEGLDLSPPELRRSISQSMLTHGDRVGAVAYGNRTLKIPLRLTGTTTDAAATVLGSLARELNRPRNLLRVQLGSVPVFFRTFQAPDYTLDLLRFLLCDSQVTLEIPAEPFAYGLREAVSTVTVRANPTSTNGGFFDIANVKGDVETPLYISGASGSLLVATRGRGTVANFPWYSQAESMTTLYADTSVQANDANASGTGSNRLRTTFSTNAAMTARMAVFGWPLPGGPSTAQRAELPGSYRVLVRLRRNGSGTGTMRVRMDPRNSTGTAVTLSIPTGTWYLLDLGLLHLPVRARGFDGVNYPGDVNFYLLAERTSGTDTLDWDYIGLVPADESTLIVSASSTVVLDGPNNNVYVVYINGTGLFDPATFVGVGDEVPWVGGMPHLTPGTTTRVFYILDYGGNAGSGNVLTGTQVVTPYYWPRYLLVPGS